MIFTVGCSGVPLASKEQDEIAKNFNPPPDKAYIYVMRESRNSAWAADMRVYLNSKYTGRLRNDNYLLLNVNPGRHTVAAGHPVAGHDPFHRKSSITLEVLPGKMYFIKGHMVISGHLPLSRVNTEEAKKEIMNYFRVPLEENE
jgi:hypothetical protein